jgi:spectrin beta
MPGFQHSDHAAALFFQTLILLQKTNADWWSIRKSNGQEGYLPANYIKEVEPKVVKKLVKKPVRIQEQVPVKKIGYRKEKQLVAKRPSLKKKDSGSGGGGRKLRRTPSVRSQANLHFDRENVEQRQQTINETYKKLCTFSQIRRQSLEDAIQIFAFYRECDSFEAWMKDKETMLQTQESLSQNMESIRRKFEILITDLAANTPVLQGINQMATDMIQNRHSQSDAIKRRQKDINERWDRLNRLKMHKEKTLQGASSIEMFQDMCDELKDWIKEKQNVLNNEDLGKDLRSVQALQRKHQNLEYDMEPLQDKLNKMNLLANAVRQSYPGEAGHVNQREKEIMDM